MNQEGVDPMRRSPGSFGESAQKGDLSVQRRRPGLAVFGRGGPPASP